MREFANLGGADGIVKPPALIDAQAVLHVLLVVRFRYPLIVDSLPLVRPCRRVDHRKCRPTLHLPTPPYADMLCAPVFRLLRSYGPFDSLDPRSGVTEIGRAH